MLKAFLVEVTKRVLRVVECTVFPINLFCQAKVGKKEIGKKSYSHERPLEKGEDEKENDLRRTILNDFVSSFYIKSI